jgi:hypothetical protein
LLPHRSTLRLERTLHGGPNSVRVLLPEGGHHRQQSREETYHDPLSDEVTGNFRGMGF